MRWITSPARRPSRTIRVTLWCASDMFGGSLAIQRRQALALVTTAASGWLTSCAIDAASSPIVVTRPTCASSISIRRTFCSARARSVSSR